MVRKRASEVSSPRLKSKTEEEEEPVLPDSSCCRSKVKIVST